MATFSGLSFTSPGVKSLSPVARLPELSFRRHCASGYRFSKLKSGSSLIDSTRKPCLQNHHFPRRCSGSNHGLSVGRGYQLSSNDDSDRDPYLLSLMREAIESIRGLLQFLAEQPSQLRYIEWPGFQSMLKTACLTLVIVAFLIVALSSVDSALSYLLAFLLRKRS